MIPIGLLPYNYTIIHEASKNLKPFNERNLTLYLNFSPNTHSDRPVIKDYIKQKFWGDTDIVIADKWITWDVYLSHLGNAKFTVSPPGVGLDCYRMWEAAIMRTIPIVLRNEISHLYDGLPVMFVDSWTDIKRENLEKFEKKYLKTFKNGCPPDRPKIWARYWLTKIMEFKRSSKLKFCNKI
uniref:Exostosin GT47 domain-containing protein n=1 Tax=Panagrolaimus davidi TaxID=227884 RepID=A0A914P168_9BILA